MLFLDFYEWLCFLGEFSKKTEYEWYIKPHPDYMPGTLKTLNKIIIKYPKLSLISPKISNHQLVKEGISFALTCYGSIGHELPLLGVQVINAGYNPHIAYDFNGHAKSVEEYAYLLHNLEKLDKKADVDEIYEFYYMRYYYTMVDDLIYPSYRQMLKNLVSEELSGPKGYEYFLNQLTNTRHQKIIQRIRNFIESGKKNYFLKGPE